MQIAYRIIYTLVIGLALFASSLQAQTAEFERVLGTNYGPITYKSEKIANWRIMSDFRQRTSTEAYIYDNSYSYPAGSQSVMSASRQFDTRIPNRVYAVYKTNNTAVLHYAEWLYIPDDVGTFTRLGWLLGGNSGLNMAVELERREVGEQENTALSLGVQYVF
tara:strand:+ start:97 stop:585 length:489 start_codon:yes stop_codon:yes gene_type:complete